jgi:hypothetical protein
MQTAYARRAAASTTIPLTNAAHAQEYAKISLRTLAIVTLPRAASPIRAATLQHRGEKVKFFEPEPLNARKQRLRAREANGDIRKSWRRSDARNLIPSPQDCPTAPR